MQDQKKGVAWLEEKKAAMEGRPVEKASPNQSHKVEKKHDRHSNTGVSGQPKKGGGGGKGTWGKGGMDDLQDTPEMDEHDPNYDSGEDEIVISKREIINPISFILEEYYSSGEVEDAIKSLGELEFQINLHTDFVKKALLLAVERQAYEREITSRLLCSLYNNKVVKPENISDGFQAALDRLSDLILDSPDATEVISKFLARAVMDEVIPPAFLKHAIAESSQAKEALALANGLVSEPHRMDRLAHIWGPGDLRSVKRLKEEVDLLFGEYLQTGDKDEADKCVRKLNAPSFYSQLVNRAIRMAIQNPEEGRKKISSLLKFFVETGLLSQSDVVKGFKSVRNNLADIKLDTPNASNVLQEFEGMAKNEGYLPNTYTV